MAAVAAPVVVGVVLDQTHVRFVADGGVSRLLRAQHHALAGLVLGNEIMQREARVGAVFGMIVVVVEARAVGEHGVGEEFFPGEMPAPGGVAAQVVGIVVQSFDPLAAQVHARALGPIVPPAKAARQRRATHEHGRLVGEVNGFPAVSAEHAVLGLDPHGAIHRCFPAFAIVESSIASGSVDRGIADAAVLPKALLSYRKLTASPVARGLVPRLQRLAPVFHRWHWEPCLLPGSARACPPLFGRCGQNGESGAFRADQ